MKQHSSSLVIGVVVSIVLGFGIVAGVWLSLRSASALGYEPDVLRATKTGPNSAKLSLSTFPDSMVCHGDGGGAHPDWVTYCPSTSLEVPANSIVTIEIKNYDSSTPLHNDYFQHVRGTVGGVEIVNNKPITQIDIGGAGHTFTIQSPPDTLYPLFVSVPVVGVPDNETATENVAGQSYPKPTIISFQIQTGPPGSYIWHCYDPCGSGLQGSNQGFGGPMSTTGYMAGTLTVSSY